MPSSCGHLVSHASNGFHFGHGQSARLFVASLQNPQVWGTPLWNELPLEVARALVG